uniref:F-box domain-containing protein n=1 Tax=Plectus sambesii TaxID=2011161 RepID=A0A914XJ78_9BILA
MAALETEVARLQAENDRLQRALTDVCGQVLCGQLTGRLPDNFLEQFSQLPDRPLEHVLRFLPAREVVQMRHVSRKFNNLIKKCSNTMPKKEHNGSISFKSYDAGELSVELFDQYGRGIAETTLTGNKIALSELLRFIRIDGLMYFGEGLSATNKVLDQLSKAWLTIRPKVVVFSGDFSRTSRDTLRAFLVKVDPSIRRLHFQYASNMAVSILSDDVIGAAGRLDSLIVMPVPWYSRRPDLEISDETLLAMADSDHVSSYFLVKGCLGITPSGIRAFVQKWMNKWIRKGELKAGATSSSYRYRYEWDRCTLTFYNCANVTPAEVERACGDLLKKETTAILSEDVNDRVLYCIQCHSSKRRLEILFSSEPFRSHFVTEPRQGIALDRLIYGRLTDDGVDSEMEDEDEDDDGDDDDGFDVDFDSMATLEAEVARLQAKNDRLRRALTDVCGQILCGQLTGRLPDNFLEQFSQLPDRPLEHVLRFLPALQVVQMRHVSRKFNNLITKCSKTMQKKEHNGSILFKSDDTGELSVELFEDSGREITETTLTGNKIALSELLRFIRIDGLMYFGEGLSATDEVLDQLNKSWLTVRPKLVVFSGDFSRTSQDSLRAFLVKVEPSIRRLNFQLASNHGDSLLSDDLIGAAGRLDSLIVMPACRGSELPDLKFGDNMLLAMADADRVSLYFFVKGCSGITPSGIRAFVQKWMKKWMKNGKPKAGANSTSYRCPREWDYCTLIFHKCANVTPAAVEEACGDLLNKETIKLVYCEDVSDRILYSIQCNSNKRRLEIRFNSDSYRSHFITEPRPGVALDRLIDGRYDSDEEDEDEDCDLNGNNFDDENFIENFVNSMDDYDTMDEDAMF